MAGRPLRRARMNAGRISQYLVQDWNMRDVSWHKLVEAASVEEAKKKAHAPDPLAITKAPAGTRFFAVRAYGEGYGWFHAGYFAARDAEDAERQGAASLARDGIRSHSVEATPLEPGFLRLDEED